MVKQIPNEQNVQNILSSKDLSFADRECSMNKVFSQNLIKRFLFKAFYPADWKGQFKSSSLYFFLIESFVNIYLPAEFEK